MLGGGLFHPETLAFRAFVGLLQDVVAVDDGCC